MNCNHNWQNSFRDYCGANVCHKCEQHGYVNEQTGEGQLLARCFCGWNLNGQILEDDVNVD